MDAQTKPFSSQPGRRVVCQQDSIWALPRQSDGGLLACAKG